MSHNHLTICERAQLEVLIGFGWSTRKIGQILCRHHSTIAREINKSGLKTSYSAIEAQKNYSKRRQNCKSKGKGTSPLNRLILARLQDSWSPEQIEGRLLKGTVSCKTIYNWIKKGLIENATQYLRQKGKRQKPTENRGVLNGIKSIHDRPKAIEKREEFGHWELDTVVSGRGISKSCFATLLERKSRMYIIVPMIDRTADSMYKALKQVVSSYPIGVFNSFTSDRGKEFACHAIIEKELKVPIYFADPYSSWQRGSNENANGLLREFFPKSSDLGKIPKTVVFDCLSKILNRPRKILDWKTSFEVFIDEVSQLA